MDVPLISPEMKEQIAKRARAWERWVLKKPPLPEEETRPQE